MKIRARQKPLYPETVTSISKRLLKFIHVSAIKISSPDRACKQSISCKYNICAIKAYPARTVPPGVCKISNFKFPISNLSPSLTNMSGLRQWFKFVSPECSLIFCASVNLKFIFMNHYLCACFTFYVSNGPYMVKVSVGAYNIFHLELIFFYDFHYPVRLVSGSIIIASIVFSSAMIKQFTSSGPTTRLFYEHIIPPS